jgi:histidinol phosphatase-like enzyme (inositol monophosphatase family)
MSRTANARGTIQRLPAAVLAGWLADANGLADVAARRSMPPFRAGRVGFESKPDGSPVTPLDRAVEEAMRRRLRRLHPDHGVLGEEGDAERADAELLWVLDPIDGTKSYVSGLPQWGTLIALLQRGRTVLGVVDVPALGERWCAAGRRGTTHRRARDAWVRCRTSECRTLEAARLCLPDPSGFTGAQAGAVERMARQVAIVRHGGDCHAYALLASGRLDVVVEAGLDAHDVFAPLRVVENAGGVITDWSGGTLALDMRGDVVAAATPELHALALGWLSNRASHRAR